KHPSSELRNLAHHAPFSKSLAAACRWGWPGVAREPSSRSESLKFVQMAGRGAIIFITALESIAETDQGFSTLTYWRLADDGHGNSRFHNSRFASGTQPGAAGTGGDYHGRRQVFDVWRLGAPINCLGRGVAADKKCQAWPVCRVVLRQSRVD